MIRSILTFSSKKKENEKNSDSQYTAKTVNSSRSQVEEEEEGKRVERCIGKSALRNYEARKNDPMKQSLTDFNLAVHYKSRGELDAAKKHIMDAHTQRKIHLGPNHPLVAATLEVLGDIAEQNQSWEEAQLHYEHALKIVESDNLNNNNNNNKGLLSPTNDKCLALMSIVQKAEEGNYSVPQVRRRVKRKLQKIVNDHPPLSIDVSSQSIPDQIPIHTTMVQQNHSQQDDQNTMPIVKTIIRQKPALKNTLPIVQGQIKHHATKRKSSSSSCDQPQNDDILFLPNTNRQREYSQPNQTNTYRDSSESDVSFVPFDNNIRRHKIPHSVNCDHDDHSDSDDDIQFAPSNNFTKRDRHHMFLRTQQGMVKN